MTIHALKSLTAELATQLGIRVPIINVVDAPELSTDTQMGGADPVGWAIAVKRGIPDLDQALTLSHEIRHLWQSIHMPEAFRDYVQLSNRPTLEDYNLQPAEIDANAFALIIMTNFFHVRPLFQNLSDNARSQIEQRAKQIDEEAII